MAIQDNKPVPFQVSNRAATYNRDVLRPRIIKDRAALDIAVYQCEDPIAYAQAVMASYTPIELPFRWGPMWSTAWFKVKGIVPKSWAGGQVMLHADTGTEALVFKDGVPYHGLSPNHKRVPLFKKCAGGETYEGYIEAAANQMFGALKTAPADLQAAGTPALMTVMELALFDPDIYQLSMDIDFLVRLHAAFFEGENWRSWESRGHWSPDRPIDPRAREITRALDLAMDVLNEDDLSVTAKKARAILKPVITSSAPEGEPRCRAVGHAHIDTAWLWPLRETRRKCSRTFSTVLRNMEKYPEYTFVQSQAQLYQFVKEDNPGLLDEIRRRVKQGRWEPGGGMWVEADCNIASGEALVRQFLHGSLYWKDLFGKNIEQTYLWLPDVFGYSAALPQILHHCRITTFFTQKISWNQYNTFPHTTFWWQGIDGTRVLSHFYPTNNYNGNALPDELIRGDRNNQQADAAPMWMEVYGWGDGGGGPTAEQIEYLRRAKDCNGVPKTRQQTPSEFCVDLHRSVTDKKLPVWVGELYLELHRGTLTTQSKTKLGNRKSELGLREAEIWATTAWGTSAAYPQDRFDRAWKLTLLNQFHDILPGSSIKWVYDDNEKQYQDILGTVADIKRDAMDAIAKTLDTTGYKKPVAVFNPTEEPFSGVVSVPAKAFKTGQQSTTLDGENVRLLFADHATALGCSVRDAADMANTADSVAPVTVKGRVLDNGILKVTVDAAGRIASLIVKSSGREAVPAGQPMNQLMLYIDRPSQWEAWDVDLHYLGMGTPFGSKADIRIVDAGPLRAALEVRRTIGKKSSMVQRIQLDAGARRVDFITKIDWHESKKILRVLNPVDVNSDYASYDIQYGYLRRPTHFNTSWDYARFEVSAHMWMDLSERGFGVALLNDCKYGHSCIGNVMGLSLLRATNTPGENADIGEQRFTYSLMPHIGDPIDARVPAQARLLNMPPAARVLTPAAALPTPAPRIAPPVITCDSGVRVEAFKKAERADAVIVRLVEADGVRNTATINWPFPVKTVTAVDCMEEPTDLFDIEHDAAANATRVTFTPFGIRTLAVTM